MSYDESDEDGEWEVVDIVHTTTSIKSNNKKSKPAKQEDVDKLAQDIRTQLTLKTTHDTQQMLLLEQKLRQQKEFSESQLAVIQSKLSEITRVQRQQKLQQKDLDKKARDLENKQKQQLLEQQIQIQSLSDHQMLTQKQLIEANQKIIKTENITKNVNQNIQSLKYKQQQQLIQQQMNEQQLQQQKQLAQLAQIAAQQQLAQQQQQQQQNINIQSHSHSNEPPHMRPQIQPQIQPNLHGNVNVNGSGGKNSWLPSFFAFGNNKNGKGQNNMNIQDMDMGNSTPTPPPIFGVNNNNIINNNNKMNPEEKEPILMDDDDDDVLKWNNDYGSNPLYNNPQLLKTKAVIGEGKFAPCEKRQCGWILVNKSTHLLKVSARLECIGGDKEEYGIQIKTEKLYEFQLKPKEEIYILIEVIAPPIIGKYCAFYRLIIDNNIKIGEMLEVMCHVNAVFNEKKENKIAQIIKMGFNDRKKVVQTLKKTKWNVQQTVDTLIGL